MADGAENHTGEDFDKRVTKLRNSLRDCELKRLELEKKMSHYHSSNAHLCRRTYERLKNSLRETCEKEKKARLRNGAFLQEFGSLEARLSFLLSNSRISQHMKMPQVSRQAEINTGADMSRRIYHPATIFMGRQMSANSSIEHCLTQRKSPQPTKSFSISDPHSARQAAINSNVTDSCVVPANSDTQCLNKPDKIDGETSSFQISQKMPVTSIASEDARTHRAEIDKTQSGRKHLVESRQSAQLSSQTLKRLSPENRTGDLQNDSPGSKVEDALMYGRLVPNEERFTHASPSGSPPDASDYINNQTSDNQSACENLPAFHPDSKNDDSDVLDSSSDLTVSITESEDMSAADLLDAIDGKKDPLEPRAKNEHEEESASNKKLSNNKMASSPEHISYEDSSSISAISPNNLSSKGFIHLLQCIEGMLKRMEAVPTQLYQDTGVSHKRREYLISLCNQMKPLKTEDLEACTALVTRQLQTDSGRFLHKESNDHNRDQDETRTISASLREHLLGHISFLKERGILKGGVPAGFANVLMLHDEMKSQQGNLNVAGDFNSPTSVSSTDEQSSSLQKRDQTVDVPYNHMLRHEDYRRKNEDDTSSCEDDSGDGKFGEKKRVPGNPAVLLQDVKDKINIDEDKIEEFSDVSDIEIPGLTRDHSNVRGSSRNKHSSEGTLSSSEPSPIHRKENAPSAPANLTFNKGPKNIKSKAFWGDSDDSSSDIEAILRPQTNHTVADDFDDFFD